MSEPPVGTIVHDRTGWAWERLDDGWHIWHYPFGDAIPDPEGRPFLGTDAFPWRTLIVRYGPITQGMQP